MSVRELTAADRPILQRGGRCVVVASMEGGEVAGRCIESVLTHTPAEVAVVLAVAPEAAEAVAAMLERMPFEREAALWLWRGGDSVQGEGSAGAVARALSLLAPADVALLSEPCRVSAGWLTRLQAAARADTNTATASALIDVGSPLAVCDSGERRPTGRRDCRSKRPDDIVTLAEALAGAAAPLWPRLGRIAGPCVYVRREALELAGPLDAEMPLSDALEAEFSERCRLSGLAHVAADDVIVQRLAPVPTGGAAGCGLEGGNASAPPPAAISSVLASALESARGPRARLPVTIDARALGAAMTGTQVHLLELVCALAHTGSLRLRLLVLKERIDEAMLALLRELPCTELLDVADVEDGTPRSVVFHRPQQTFAGDDIRVAFQLGERFVLTQLDLIAYDNPGYFADLQSWERCRRAIRQGMVAADRVVVLSEHTRRQLLADALAEAERLRVVPPGLDHRFPGHSAEPAAPAASAAPADASSPLPAGLAGGEYLLCLGTDFRHKNRLFALRMFEELRERHGWQGSLVLAGAHVPYGSSVELERDFLSQRPRLARDVVVLGAQAEPEKAALMAGAAALLYPSAYEGFGLVPFESALLGVPCAFAPQASLAELAPTSAATIVPWDPSASAARLHALLLDAEQRARHLRSLTHAASELTWQRAAEAMVAIYRELAAAPVRDAVAVAADAAQAEHEAAEHERALVADHDALVARLVGERAHAQRMYEELNAKVGWGLALIEPGGALPEDAQRLALAIAARPTLSRVLFGTISAGYRAMRRAGRAVRAVRAVPRGRV